MSLVSEFQKIIELRIDQADKSDPDWWDAILEELPSGFAKGYLYSETRRMGDIHVRPKEFVEVVKGLIYHNIWS